MNLIRFLFVDNYYYHFWPDISGDLYSKPIMQLMAVRPVIGSAVVERRSQMISSERRKRCGLPWKYHTTSLSEAALFQLLKANSIHLLIFLEF